MQNNTYPALCDDQIDLKKVFRILWGSRKLIVAITACFSALFLIIALLIPPQYKSSSVLAPVSKQFSGAGQSLEKFGGLASLAGIHMGLTESSEPQIAHEIMQSWAFIDRFIKNNNLEVEIYAATGWDRETNTLDIDSSLYDEQSQSWLIDAGNGQFRGPTSWELYEEFMKMFSLSSDMETGLVTLSVKYYSPYIAKQWVDLFFAEINRHMQQRKLSRVNSNIEYLQDQIAKTSISHMESVFYTIIEEQIKNKMLAEATPEHTFLVVSQSMVPEERTGPKPYFLTILGSMLGLLISILVVLLRYNMSDSKEQPSG